MDLVEFEEVAGGVLTSLKGEVQHIKECMQEPMMHISGDL